VSRYPGHSCSHALILIHTSIHSHSHSHSNQNQNQKQRQNKIPPAPFEKGGENQSQSQKLWSSTDHGAGDSPEVLACRRRYSSFNQHFNLEQDLFYFFSEKKIKNKT